MRVLFVGIYDPEYSRNRVLMRGFQENGWDVEECRIDPRLCRGARKYWSLLKKAGKIRGNGIDLVFVAFPGHSVIWLSRILFPRKTIIFDAFLSLYDSNVFDRKLYGRLSFKGLRDYVLDFYSTRLATKVLVDTAEHKKYFIETFGTNQKKIHVVPISADDHIFSPRKEILKKEGPIIVHFHGTFIPLQGIDYILDAAKELGSGFEFRIVGEGQLFKGIKKRVESEKIENVKLLGKVKFEKVPEAIAEADICLGIFGDTEKTERVIPNKVYECVSMGKPVITANTSAIREVFEGGKDVILCDRASGKSLAATLRSAKDNPKLLAKIASGGLATFEAKLRPEALISRLLNEFHDHEN